MSKDRLETETDLSVGIRDGQVCMDISIVESEPLRAIMLDTAGARTLAGLLQRKASDLDGYPGTKESGEYFIYFNTQEGDKIQAVRVRIDLVPITSDSDAEFNVDLVNHPLYKELRRYVLANVGR